MFCDQCGFKNTQGDTFCPNCGNRLIDDLPAEQEATTAEAVAEDQSTVEQTITNQTATDQPVGADQDATNQTAVLANQTPLSQTAVPQTTEPQTATTTVIPTPESAGAVPTSLPDATASAEATKVAPKKRRLAIIVSIVAAVIVIALVATFTTWKLELWGGKTLPSQQTIAEELQVKDSKNISAKKVAKHLKDKGFTVKIERVFSGSKQGNFIGYQGANADSRQALDKQVIVQESAGPGVPQGTVGKKAETVVSTLQTMGVPVHYKQIAVHDTKAHPAGSVVMTSPADGMPLAKADSERGIMVAVASDQGGIPVDIQGMDPTEAQSMLENMGYTVNTAYKFSSKQYIDKVAATNPAPGSALDEGDNVTLYIGADASKTMDIIAQSSSFGSTLSLNADAVTGRYCKSTVEDTSKDCVTLSPHKMKFPLTFTGVTMNDSENVMNVFPYSQGPMPLDSATSGGKSPYDDMLFNENWGAFEIFSFQNTLQCGHDYADDGDDVVCSQGKFHQAFEWMDAHPSDAEEPVTHVMTDYLAYAPVGTDITAWQESDYFDKDATRTAAKDKKVDATRPFIVVRDSSLYDETSYTDDANNHELFTPSSDLNHPRMVPMKPAISDKTVYYLVEQNDPDWDALKDIEVKGAKKVDAAKSADKLTSDTLKDIAGEYVLSAGIGLWGDALTINKDGNYEGHYTDINMGGASDPAKYPNGQMSVANYSGTLSKAKKNDDGTITMNVTYKLDGTPGEVKDVDGTETTTVDGMFKNYSTITIYPAGYNIADLPEDVRNWAPWYGDDSYLSKQTQYPIIAGSDNKNGTRAYYSTQESQ